LKITIEKFHLACSTGNTHVISLFLESQPSLIDLKTKQGWTGLVMACFNQHKKAIELLLLKGANVNAVNTKGTTVFMYAKTPIQNTHSNTYILKLLLNYGAKINQVDMHQKTVLDYVEENGDQNLANWLKDQGALNGNKLKENLK
jgi:ankyrin repeat protein|tara:strand:+ start:84 stop:518 length:435 start_codon:yes stop_codon:yes gene_type:complete